MTGCSSIMRRAVDGRQVRDRERGVSYSRSRCFLESKGGLECGVCHNPHDVPRGERAVRHYDAACKKCHGGQLTQAVAAGKHTRAGGCADCHMPKRRTEEAPGDGSLIQRLRHLRRRRSKSEMRFARSGSVLSSDLPPSPTRSCIRLAQVIDGSNGEGIARLAGAVQRFPFARPEFSFNLAKAAHSGRAAEGGGVPGRSGATRDGGCTTEPGRGITRGAGRGCRDAGAQRSCPNKAAVWHELGLAYHAQGRVVEPPKQSSRRLD
jgi:hypothetical protein